MSAVKMDLTTRRGESLEGAQELSNREQCREVTDDVTRVTAEVPQVRKTSSFSIRNLVGTDSDRPPDRNVNTNDGKFDYVIQYLPTFNVFSTYLL